MEPASSAPFPDPPKEPNLSPVRYNALKHGILSVSPVIPWLEDETDWLTFRDSIFESLQPQDGLQQALADRAAALFWRLMRVIRYERESVYRNLSDLRSDLRTDGDILRNQPLDPSTPAAQDQMDRMAMDRLLPDEAGLNRIMRYETKLHRFLLQTLHQFQALRAVPKAPRVRNDLPQTEITRIAVHAPRSTMPTRFH